MTTLIVKIDEKVVGRLNLSEKHLFSFAYDEAYLKDSRIPLSLSLPLKLEPYLNDESHPFFANLLPEERIRTAIARNLGLSEKNDFGILEKIGGDCAGAVTVSTEDSDKAADTSRYRELSLDELFAMIRELPRRPLLAGEKGVRLSLAGAQKKLPVFYDGQTFHLGLGSAPSTHIIKPAIETLDGSVENEAFCMLLGREVGLNVPSCFILEHEGERVFVVERYDRLMGNEKVLRLHQEDFCQALGVAPEYKYEAEGGPSIKAAIEVLRESSIRAGADVLSLLDWVIFNYLIGNSDTHGKNISLLLLADGPRLAPYYDQLSTRVYAHYGVSEGLAMKIGGEGNPDMVRKEHWEKLAVEVGVKPKLVLKRVEGMAKAIQEKRLPLFKGAFSKYRCDCLYRLQEFIDTQVERVLRGL